MYYYVFNWETLKMGSPDVDLIKLDSFDVAHVQSLYDF